MLGSVHEVEKFGIPGITSWFGVGTTGKRILKQQVHDSVVTALFHKYTPCLKVQPVASQMQSGVNISQQFGDVALAGRRRLKSPGSRIKKRKNRTIVTGVKFRRRQQQVRVIDPTDGHGPGTGRSPPGHSVFRNFMDHSDFSRERGRQPSLRHGLPLSTGFE
jgi:hypothetical protein